VTPDKVRRRIDELAYDGGYIATPSHGIPYAPAASRTGNTEMQKKTATLLLHWHLHGRG
jgi:hypothetical protein